VEVHRLELLGEEALRGLVSAEQLLLRHLPQEPAVRGAPQRVLVRTKERSERTELILGDRVEVLCRHQRDPLQVADALYLFRVDVVLVEQLPVEGTERIEEPLDEGAQEHLLHADRGASVEAVPGASHGLERPSPTSGSPR
jgi:hypothetical protein